MLSPDVQDIGNSVGIGINNNFLQHEAPFVPSSTTVVTIFAGGNDANTLATAIDRGAAGSTAPNAYIDAQVAAFADDMRELVGIVRGRAPSARIVVLNLPNFAGVPFAVGRPTRDRQWLQRLSVGFSVQGINTLTGHERHGRGLAVQPAVVSGRRRTRPTASTPTTPATRTSATR